MKITVENANDVLHQMITSGDTETQAKAWKVVHKFCIQQGMDFSFDEDLSGLQKVIKFISELQLASADEGCNTSDDGNNL